ncbi:MAG TPA: beta-eliminating lyase-related protein [Ktedonosporobacter sp.]|jgi:threonine aldolase|nr:beta-eliminating lyase-related protein [Ktedonosporobacter sp.]
MTDKRDITSIQNACTRFLTHHYRKSPHQILSDLAQATDPSIQADRYGQGQVITQFEEEIAALLGKEAAVFMPSGTMCQQIALRIWANRRQSKNVAFHPTCHLEIHEQQGYRALHGLHGIPVGSPYQLLTLPDLQAIAEPLGAVLLELPQREIGGQLPSWEELVEIIEWARSRHIPTHLDGARLWECQPFYGREYAAIAALFDTVYVSFYKVLGGIAGAALAGPSDVIAEARTWQRRHGGNLIHLFPYVLSARKGLADHLGEIATYCAKARNVASILASFPQIQVVPNPPQTNMMHVFLYGERAKLIDAALDIAEETGTWLFPSLVPAQLPSYHKFELTVGRATLDLPDETIRELFQLLFAKAGVERGSQ